MIRKIYQRDLKILTLEHITNRFVVKKLRLNNILSLNHILSRNSMLLFKNTTNYIDS